LRVVMSWDADDTDIDLWVTDPHGDKAYYGRPLSAQGGAMSRDFTGGFGPEAFQLKDAVPGTYTVEAHYFGDRQQKLLGPTTLMLELFTHFATPKQASQRVALKLRDQSERVLVGHFEVN
jgi:Ca-activated chloride channel homolog